MNFPDKKIHESPVGWIASHIERYVVSDGLSGHEWRPGVFSLLITTKGRKTSRLNRTGLIYGMDQDRYIIVGSNGGRPNHPNWYLNLKKNPDVFLQVKSEKFSARAKEAQGDERQRLWKMMTEIFPQYEEYKHKTKRKIPVIILEKTDI